MRRLLAVFLNIKIRTNLLLVLFIFFIMLVFGAALGVGGLYLNNNALGKVMFTQQVRTHLTDAINSYNKTQVTLGRALTSYVLDEGLNDQGDTLLKEARRQNQATHDEFNKFRELIKGVEDEDGVYQNVDDAFSSVMAGGVDPLFSLLESNQFNSYKGYLDGTTIYLEEDFLSTVLQLTKSQTNIIDEIHEDQAQQYILIQIMVAVGIGSALIVCIVAYLFLGFVVLRPLQIAGEHFDRMASGDMSQRVEVANNNEIGQLYAALRRMQESLTRVVSEVRSGVEEITAGAGEIYRGNVEFSSRTEQQAASLHQTAASMEELDGTVSQNTDNALEADSLAKSASQVAERSGNAVNGVVTIMRDISTSSGQMSEIVNVIDSIAFQTNILALNAAVEAARAGEQGRGFAVVAGEVRALAQRSAQAAREIKQLIDQSVVKVEQGSKHADEAGNIMEEVVTSIQRVTTIMGEIASASREQAEGIGQVNLAITEMDTVVQQNSSLVVQATAAAGSLQDQAQRLSEAVAFFRLNSNDLVIDVNAQEQQQLEHDESYQHDSDEYFEPEMTTT